ncbi:hypothetical protein [Mycolicibacterium sp.]|uniref:hypothetical protein n=1 Tax=Mycolicibacterium sp. TaxID=2320850 RepID=UPI00356039A1
MTIAVRMSNGTHLIPTKLGPGERVVESATVHAAGGFVVLEPGAVDFTVEGQPRTEKTVKLLRFERLAEVPELPDVVATEAQMDELRGRWENVDAFYRRITDETVVALPTARTRSLADARIVEVNETEIPADARGWTVAPEFTGIPAPLSALVPGTLGGVPELIAEQLQSQATRVRVAPPRFKEPATTLTAEFDAAFSDARTKLVKENPLNTRRNAKRVKVVDTRYVQLQATVPVTITADSLELAHAQIKGIVGAIRARIAEPHVVCATCAGHGLVLSPGVRERKFS